MTNCEGSYCCRRCGIYGDAIEFARQFMNLSFQDAAQTVEATIPDGSLFQKITTILPYQPKLLKKPPSLWISKATQYIENAHEQLLSNTETLDDIASRGLPVNVASQHKMGWAEKDLFISRSSWGLEEQSNQNGNPKTLWLPRGLTISTIQPNGQVVRIKVRRSNWQPNDKRPKYVIISGSMNGMMVLGNPKSKVMIVVESELDAYAIDYIAHDFAITVAVGSNIKNPDNITDYLAKNIEHLLICHDNDEGGEQMWLKWHKNYPHAQAFPTPVGKDIGEAIQKGFDIRKWLLHVIQN